MKARARTIVVSRRLSMFLVVVWLVPALATTEDDGRGLELYVKYQCHQCHGYEGQGGSPGGPPIVSLDYAFDVFARRTRHTNVMPAYSSEVLSDDILRAIYEYINSIPEPPDVSEMPILREALEDLDKTQERQ